MPIRIEYTSTFNHYLCAQRLHSKRNLWSRFNRFCVRIIAPALGAVILVLALLTYSPGALGLGSFQLMVGGALALVLYPLYIRYRLKSCYKRTRVGDSIRTLDFDEHSIKTQEGHIKSEFTWSAIQMIREDKHVLTLYLAPAKFLCIPKGPCAIEAIEEVKRLYRESAKRPNTASV